MLETAIQKIHKEAISNVQKHMRKCHSAEIKVQGRAMFDKTMDANKKQRTLVCSFSMKEQKTYAISALQNSLYQYISDSGTSKDNIETDRF